MSIFGLVFMSFALLLAGCGGAATNDAQGSESGNQSQALAESGTLFLKVNPEIAIDYDENGKVTGVRGMNDDGKEIITNYPDYIGKNSGDVLEDLIALIGEAGYFVEEIEGDAKKIVLEIEAGSTLPGNDFLERMAANAQHAVEAYKINSNVEVDGETYISLDDAKKIAFDHAKVDGSKAKFDDQELDIDDGVPVYELEFDIGEDEYKYDIHAITGEIIDFEHDLETKRETTQPVKPTQKDSDSNYGDSAYGTSAAPARKPAAQKSTPKPAAKPVQKNPTQKKPATKPVAKPAQKAPVNSRKSGNSDYDDSDYDDSDYDDSGYTDYDDSDYDDSDYDDSDYDDSDYD